MIKKMTALLMLLCMTFLSVISLSSCARRGYSKEQVIDMFLNNKDIILNDIENGGFTKSKKIRGIDSVNPHIKEGKLEVIFSSTAPGTGAQYCGFYYFEDEDMINDLYHQNNDEYEYIYGDNWFELREINGNNYFYLEKICDNFYYYYDDYDHDYKK